MPPGATAFSRDVPNAKTHLVGAGGFALESNLEHTSLIREGAQLVKYILISDVLNNSLYEMISWKSGARVFPISISLEMAHVQVIIDLRQEGVSQ
jgi:hypothetical protein